jgi:hypothetical protein
MYNVITLIITNTLWKKLTGYARRLYDKAFDT